MLEGPQHLADPVSERADEGAVVLVGNLACPVVELELLERGEGSVPLLEESQAALLLGRGAGRESSRAGRRSGRAT